MKQKLEKAFRFKIYINYIKSNSSVTLKSLLSFAEKNEITAITARRDIKELEELGKIKSNLGIFAIDNYDNLEISREKKTKLNVPEKKLTAELAQSLIASNTIFVSSGTTCEFMVKNIKNPLKTLYTNGLEVAKIAALNPNVGKVILLGGNFRYHSATLYGPLTNGAINELSFEQSFITATKVDLELDIYNDTDDEAYVLKNVIKKSIETYCLIDDNKFVTKGSGSKIANAVEIKGIVSNKKPTNKFTNLQIAKSKIIY